MTEGDEKDGSNLKIHEKVVEPARVSPSYHNRTPYESTAES